VYPAANVAIDIVRLSPSFCWLERNVNGCTSLFFQDPETVRPLDLKSPPGSPLKACTLFSLFFFLAQRYTLVTFSS